MKINPADLHQVEVFKDAPLEDLNRLVENRFFARLKKIVFSFFKATLLLLAAQSWLNSNLNIPATSCSLTMPSPELTMVLGVCFM